MDPVQPPPMEFPHVGTYFRLGDKDHQQTNIYDVSFYPYLEPGDDPVFAAVAERNIFICRPGSSKTSGPLEILRILQDPQDDASLNSVVWSQDPETLDPLVCVAGSRSKKIKVLNVKTGEFVRAVGGHGGDINDLKISPKSPQILASCSADYTIRLWHLDQKYQKQPCAAILSGEGHRQAILSLGFHGNGNWLLSGGQDTMVCLWKVPLNLEETVGTDKPTMVHFPHFTTTDIHSNYVDCVKFWGDFILSRASENQSSGHGKSAEADILLWKIDGFSSTTQTQPSAPMPIQGQHTRSAFGGRFQRLLTFEMKDASPFYMRFGLFDQIGHRPILVLGNIKGYYSFWDLQKLEEGYDAIEEAAAMAARNRKRKRGSALNPNRSTADAGVKDASSNASNASSAIASHVSSPAALERKFDVSDAYKRIKAHREIVVPCPISFTCRAVAWSNDGKHCVAVGDFGMMVLFERWKK